MLYWKQIRCHGLIIWACLLLGVLQVWLRSAHIQGLRWVPGRLSVLTVYAGHRHRRLPASAPYRRQRRELPSVKPPQPLGPTPPLVTLVDPNPGIRPFRSTHGLQGRQRASYVVRKRLKSPTHHLCFSVLPIIININGWHILISSCFTKVKPKYLVRSHYTQRPSLKHGTAVNRDISPHFTALNNRAEEKGGHYNTTEHDKGYLKWQTPHLRTIQGVLYIFSLAHGPPDAI